MYVACSTLCFSKEPIEAALRRIAELEFNKYELALVEDDGQLRPSEVAENPESSLRRLRQGPGLTASALDLYFGSIDEATYRKRFEAICRFAKPLTVAVLAIDAAPSGSPVDAEIARLSGLAEIARREGLVLTLRTDNATLAGDPAVALNICKAVPGLALTLDPSHALQGPHKTAAFDDLMPYVQNAHFRDTGKNPGEFQVRIGQGKIDYARIINQLARHGYDRSLTVSVHDAIPGDFDTLVEVRKLKLLLESLI